MVNGGPFCKRDADCNGHGFCESEELCVCDEGYSYFALCYNGPNHHFAFVVAAQLVLCALTLRVLLSAVSRIRWILRSRKQQDGHLSAWQKNVLGVCTAVAASFSLQLLYIADGASYWGFLSFGVSRLVLTLSWQLQVTAGFLFLRRCLVMQEALVGNTSRASLVHDIVGVSCILLILFIYPLAFLRGLRRLFFTLHILIPFLYGVRSIVVSSMCYLCMHCLSLLHAFFRY